MHETYTPHSELLMRFSFQYIASIIKSNCMVTGFSSVWGESENSEKSPVSHVTLVCRPNVISVHVLHMLTIKYVMLQLSTYIP